MTKTAWALIAALLLSLASAGCGEDTPVRDLRAELATLHDRIAEAKETAELHQGGLIGEMAEMRHETLLLSAALLENRLIAEEGAVPARLVAPAAAPDPVRAQQILRHITAAEELYERARKQATTNESVTGGLARTTVVTQELALAQLWLAYYQSAYGVVVPGQEEGKHTPLQEVAVGSGASAPAEPVRVFEDLDAAGEDLGAAGESTQQRAGPKNEREPTTAPQRRYGRDDTARIQVLLQEAGFDPGIVDGRWGPRTQSAVTEFQRARGLSASGRPDAATLEALGLY